MKSYQRISGKDKENIYESFIKTGPQWALESSDHVIISTQSQKETESKGALK